MAFKDLPDFPGVQLLQRSLQRKRLGHGYLFTAHEIEPLETLARMLAKTLNCRKPVKLDGAPIDCCDQCLVCRKIEHSSHADVHWVRPESKTRIITVDQMRELMKEIQLKPTEAEYKVAVVVCADRLRTEAANAFLKTLEEPPAKSIIILLTTEPQRVLETILSRCLRLNFGTGTFQPLSPDLMKWLKEFSQMAAAQQKSLLGRYRLMDVLLRKLGEIKSNIDQTLSARSPLQQYKEAEKDLVDRWEAELAAAIEAEYRRQRMDLLGVLHRWLRDVWIQTLRNQSPVANAQGEGAGRPTANEAGASLQLLNFPELAETRGVAGRISPADATQNLEVVEQLQRRLATNVQEALALEVGLLKLRL